jgi:hypothetical protein
MNAYRWFTHGGAAAVVVWFGLVPDPANAQTEVVPRGNTWAYFDDLTRAANQYPNNQFSWNAPEYDISQPPSGEWTVGDAPFAHDRVDGIHPPATVLDAPAVNEAAVLFRTSFSLDSSLVGGKIVRASVLCDDGCVGYLNGVEFFRLNLPSGSIGPNTDTEVAVSETLYNQIAAGVTEGTLRLGENILAVEVHNNGVGSTDLGFEMSLTIEAPPIPEPGTGVLADVLALVFCLKRACRALSARRPSCGEG